MAEEIKIVEGFKEEFEKSVCEALDDGWSVCLETHKMGELVGRTYYSCVFARVKKEGKK